MLPCNFLFPWLSEATEALRIRLRRCLMEARCRCHYAFYSTHIDRSKVKGPGLGQGLGPGLGLGLGLGLD